MHTQHLLECAFLSEGCWGFPLETAHPMLELSLFFNSSAILPVFFWLSKSLVVLDITKCCFQSIREMTHYLLASFFFLGNPFIDLLLARSCKGCVLVVIKYRYLFGDFSKFEEDFWKTLTRPIDRIVLI